MRGPGERGDVDDGVGRLLGGEDEAVAHHEPAFGVGVGDLDGGAVADGDHVPHSKAVLEGMLSVHISHP